VKPNALLAAIPAAIASAAALWFLSPADRRDSGLAVSPFGTAELLIVNVLFALPLAAVVAGWTSTWLTGSRSFLPFAIVAAMAVPFAVGAIATSDLVAGLGFVPRALLRTLACTILAWPFFSAFGPCVRRDRASWLLAMAAAIVLPTVYADRIVADAIRTGNELLRDDRPIAARPHWLIVADIDPERTVPGFQKSTTAPDVLALIEKEAGRLDKVAASKSVKPELRAEALAGLEKFDEAERAFRALPPSPPNRVRLARFLAQRERYPESDELLQSLKEERDPELQREAYEALARNATARFDRTAVEQILNEAIDRLPKYAGSFLFELARMYRQAGRPLEALRTFDRAVDADASLAEAAAPHRRAIREQTPGCLVGR